MPLPSLRYFYLFTTTISSFRSLSALFNFTLMPLFPFLQFLFITFNFHHPTISSTCYFYHPRYHSLFSISFPAGYVPVASALAAYYHHALFFISGLFTLFPLRYVSPTTFMAYFSYISPSTLFPVACLISRFAFALPYAFIPIYCFIPASLSSCLPTLLSSCFPPYD
jgi:hypothetical protein